MEIFNEIGIDIGYVLLGTMGVLFIVCILVIVLFVKNSRLKKKYGEFMNDTDGKSLEQAFTDKFKAVDDMKVVTKVLNSKINKLEEVISTTYRKMGIVKYDAFKEMGGKLSFALALLTDSNDGFIINCMHSSREGCYTYVKEIIKGESFVILAEEEKEALNIAIKSGDHME